MWKVTITITIPFTEQNTYNIHHTNYKTTQFTINLDWTDSSFQMVLYSKSLTSHSTQYRSFRRWAAFRSSCHCTYVAARCGNVFSHKMWHNFCKGLP